MDLNTGISSEHRALHAMFEEHYTELAMAVDVRRRLRD